MNDNFYITGGTLPHDATSYVTRQADAALLDGLRRGEFCYVLNTRQMGKSSLMVRAAAQLKAEGCRVAILDLTAVGKNVSVEQWYFGLLSRIGMQLLSQEDLPAFWKGNRELGPMQRFVEGLRLLLLEEKDTPKKEAEEDVKADTEKDAQLPPSSPLLAPLVLFVDEIDAVLSLPFSADEFFAGIRECYNRRAQEPVFARLTFCLLGVATPADLIRDVRTTPFNIGRRIELRDFTPQEAAPLATGLQPPAASASVSIAQKLARRLLKRVLYWTNGHPYMTQRLCREIAQQQATGVVTLSEVDRMCARLFLSKAAQESDDNLAFVRNRLLKSEADLPSLLDLYLQVRAGRRVRDEETNPLCSILRLSGAVAVEQGWLRVRNRVYAHVFDKPWALSHMPDAELRRQKRAYQRGLLRAASLASVILSLMAVLAGTALIERNHARAFADQLERAASENSILYKQREYALKNAVAEKGRANEQTQLATHHALEAVRQTLRAQEGQERERQLRKEADHLKSIADHNADRANRSAAKAVQEEEKAKATARENSKQKILIRSRLSRTDVGIAARLTSAGDVTAALAPLAEAMTLDKDEPARLAMHRRRFAATLALAPRLEHVWFADKPLRWGAYSPDRKWVAAAGEDGRARIWNVATGALLPLDIYHEGAIGYAAFSPDGTRLVTCGSDCCARVWDVKACRLLCTLRHPKREDKRNDVIYASWSRDGKRLATAYNSLIVV